MFVWGKITQLLFENTYTSYHVGSIILLLQLFLKICGQINPTAHNHMTPNTLNQTYCI
jgi:hypothetical protein